MASSLTFQNLRSKIPGKHPANLEEGQVAFNMSNPLDIFMYVGNGTDLRYDDVNKEDVSGYLQSTPEPGKGWVRYRLSQP